MCADIVKNGFQVPAAGFFGGHDGSHDGMPDDLFECKAEELQGKLVEEGDIAFHVHFEDDAAGALNQLAVFDFALANEGLGFHAFGHVPKIFDDADDLSVRRPMGGDGDFAVDRRAVLGLLNAQGLDALLSAEDASDLAVFGVTVLAAEEVVAFAPGQLLARVAAQGHEGVVDLDHVEVSVNDPHPPCGSVEYLRHLGLGASDGLFGLFLLGNVVLKADKPHPVALLIQNRGHDVAGVVD